MDFICGLILGLFLSAPVKEEPKGWLDCSFNERNEYRCRP